MRSTFDEDFAAGAHARTMASAGLDVLRPHDVGMLRRADPEQLEFATHERRMIVSYNRHDFQRLHAEWMATGRDHAGILLVNKLPEQSPGELVRRLHALSDTLADRSSDNQILLLSNFG